MPGLFRSRHAPPKRFPCWSKAAVDDWRQQTLTPLYFYDHDLANMQDALLIAREGQPAPRLDL